MAVRKQAFTLIELLVVVAIIALLISILLPSLQGARNQGKKAVCLTNLRSIAQASHSYANEDKRELIIPMHRSAVRPDSAQGFFSERWGWRLAMPHAYGGRTAQKPLPSAGGQILAMLAPGTNDMIEDNHVWGASTRPLNRYVLASIGSGDFKKMPMFHCPMDTGYPLFGPEWPDDNLDAPRENVGVANYDTVGNSFRINTCGVIWLQGETISAATLTTGAEGHGASVIEQPSRTVMYSDSLFYFWSRQNPGQPLPEVAMFPGWHKKIMGDDVSFCDGSARLARIDKLATWDQTTLDQMDYTREGNFQGPAGAYYFLRRGKTWQTDSFPAPGALTVTYNMANAPMNPGIFPMIQGYSGWPFKNYRANTTPE